jgi:hypothetical protein
MSTVLSEDRVCRSVVPDWHQEFLTYVLPAVQSIARYRLRQLTPVEREEATAEAIAVAMISFVGLLRRGRDPVKFAGSLARIAVLRVIAGRLSGSAFNNRDVLSRQTRRRHGFAVQSLDANTANGWKQIVAEDRRSTPADIATARLDIAEWLGRMTNRRRKIAESLAAGYRTEEVAEMFNLSQGRISQLRREFEESWLEFQQDNETRQVLAN